MFEYILTHLFVCFHLGSCYASLFLDSQLEDKECLLVVLVNTMNSVRPLDPETAQTVKNLPLFSAFSANYVATKCGTMDVCTDLNACDFCDVFVNGHTGTPSPALLPLFLIRAKKATANAAWVHPPIPADQVRFVRSIDDLGFFAEPNVNVAVLHSDVTCVVYSFLLGTIDRILALPRM